MSRPTLAHQTPVHETLDPRSRRTNRSIRDAAGRGALALLVVWALAFLLAAMPAAGSEPAPPFQEAVLLGWEGVVVGWSDKHDDAVGIDSMSAGQSTGTPGPYDLSQQDIAEIQSDGNWEVTLAAADIDDDGYDDLFAFSRGLDATSIDTLEYVGLTGDSHFGTWQSALKAQPSGSRLRMAAGDLDGDGHGDAVILGLDASGQLLAQTWSVVTGASAFEVVDTTLPKAGAHLLNLTTDDLDHDGKAEVVAAWPGTVTDEGADVYVAVLRWLDGGFQVAGVTTVPQSLFVTGDGSAGLLDVAVGDFEGQGSRRIVLGTVFPDRDGDDLNRRVAFTMIDPPTETGGLDQSTYFYPNYHDVNGVAITTADLNGDSKDEVQTAFGHYHYRPHAAIFTWSSGNADDADHGWAVASDIRLAKEGTSNSDALQRPILGISVGDVNYDGQLEVVPAWTSQYHVKTALLTAGGAGGLTLTMNQKLEVVEVHENATRSVSVAVGDYLNRSLVARDPHFKERKSVRQIVAIVNEPPKLDVTFDDGTYVDVNNDRDTLAVFRESAIEQDEISVTAKSAWSLSAEAKASLGAPGVGKVEARVSSMYGENLEKTGAETHSLKISFELEAACDDAIFGTTTDYEIWEYQLFQNGSSSSEETMLVVIMPDGPTSFGVPGTDLASAYAPDHELGNALSYSPAQPSDWPSDSRRQLLHHDGTVAPAGTASATLTATEIHTRTNSFSNQLELTVGVSAEADFVYGSASLDLETKGTYSNISTQTMTFEQETELEVDFAPIGDASQSYHVENYIYYADSGAMVLDYKVHSFNTWYQQHYTQPNLAFSTPLRKLTTDPELQQRSSSVRTKPCATAGETQLIADVGNHSLTGRTSGFTVEFYLGSLTGSWLGEVQFGPLGARSSASKSTACVSLPAASDQKIWAKIVPGGEADLLSADDIGWTWWNPSASTSESERGVRSVPASGSCNINAR